MLKIVFLGGPDGSLKSSETSGYIFQTPVDTVYLVCYL